MMEEWYVTIPIQRVSDLGSDTMTPIQGRSGGEDFSDIDCHSSSEHSLHHSDSVSEIIDYTSRPSTSYERFIPIQIESAELFGNEVCLEGQQANELGQSTLASWKTIPGVSSSASGQQRQTFPDVSSDGAFELGEGELSQKEEEVGGGAFEALIQEEISDNKVEVKAGGTFEPLFHEEMLGRKPPSGARTAPLPRQHFDHYYQMAIGYPPMCHIFVVVQLVMNDIDVMIKL